MMSRIELELPAFQESAKTENGSSVSFLFNQLVGTYIFFNSKIIIVTKKE